MDIFQCPLCVAGNILFNTVTEHGNDRSKLHQMIIGYRRHTLVKSHTIIGKFSTGTKGHHILLGQHHTLFLSCRTCCKKHACRQFRVQFIFSGNIRCRCPFCLIHGRRFHRCQLFRPFLLCIIDFAIQQHIRIQQPKFFLKIRYLLCIIHGHDYRTCVEECQIGNGPLIIHGPTRAAFFPVQ